MPWFYCNQCGDSIKKPKLRQHIQRCGGWSYSCVDWQGGGEGPAPRPPVVRALPAHPPGPAPLLSCTPPLAARRRLTGTPSTDTRRGKGRDEGREMHGRSPPSRPSPTSPDRSTPPPPTPPFAPGVRHRGAEVRRGGDQARWLRQRSRRLPGKGRGARQGGGRSAPQWRGWGGRRRCGWRRRRSRAPRSTGLSMRPLQCAVYILGHPRGARAR